MIRWGGLLLVERIVISSIRVVPALLAGGLELVREDRCERWQLAHFVDSLSVSDVRVYAGSSFFRPDLGFATRVSVVVCREGDVRPDPGTALYRGLSP